MRATIFLLLILFLSTQTFSQTGETIVEISTKFGVIKVKLYDNTPLHKENFVKLASDGFYDGTLFHRVIKDFMIQGGDPDSKNASQQTSLGQGGPGYTIPSEFNSKNIHKKGALAAARLGDNINPNRESSGSQFYIVQGKVYTNEELYLFEQRLKTKFSEAQRQTYTTIGGTPHLDGTYTVFGEVISGIDVVDKIANVTTGKDNRPVDDIKMTVKVK